MVWYDLIEERGGNMAKIMGTHAKQTVATVEAIEKLSALIAEQQKVITALAEAIAGEVEYYGI